MFDQQKMAQTVFNLAQDYTNVTTQVMRTSMEMYEKTLDTMMKQGLAAQEEGQKLLADWTNKAKQGQKNYWDMMTENLNKMGTFFNQGTNSTERKRTPAG